jgi:hypothetical protein
VQYHRTWFLNLIGSFEISPQDSEPVLVYPVFVHSFQDGVLQEVDELPDAAIGTRLEVHQTLNRIQPASSSSQITNVSHPRRRNPRQLLEWWDRLATIEVEVNRFAWNHHCSVCHSWLLSVEDDGWCCRDGKYKRERLPSYPEPFSSELQRDPERYSALSRRLNSLFAFTAIGTTGEFLPLPAPSNVVVTGRTYHRILHLDSGEHSLRWFLYDEQARSAAASRQHIPAGMLMATRNMMEHESEYLRQIRRAITMASDGPLAVQLDQPVAGGEVAAIIDAQNLQTISPRKVVFFRNVDRQPTFISIFSHMYEPLQYPLLFPRGTPGWSPDNPNELTQIQWYRWYFIAEERFLELGRLACEYAVDMYSRVEEERLNYLRRGRLDQVRGVVQDGREGRDDYHRGNVEGMLPASFLGSRAWSSQQVSDALALCRQYGKPSFFITMTTNPNWPEIKMQLKKGQTAADVPAIVCRVFHKKVKVLVEFIRQHFGKILYEVRVVEFQKRGLPHIHMIFKVRLILPGAFTGPWLTIYVTCSAIQSCRSIKLIL